MPRSGEGVGVSVGVSVGVGVGVGAGVGAGVGVGVGVGVAVGVRVVITLPASLVTDNSLHPRAIIINIAVASNNKPSLISNLLIIGLGANFTPNREWWE